MTETENFPNSPIPQLTSSSFIDYLRESAARMILAHSLVSSRFEDPHFVALKVTSARHREMIQYNYGLRVIIESPKRPDQQASLRRMAIEEIINPKRVHRRHNS